MEGFRAVSHDLLDLKTPEPCTSPAIRALVTCSSSARAFPTTTGTAPPRGSWLTRLPVGLSCLPEYERAAPQRPQATTSTRWRRVSSKASPRCAPATRGAGHELTVIVHDWGIAGFMFSNAVGCDRLVVFDGAPRPGERPDKLYSRLCTSTTRACSPRRPRAVSARLLSGSRRRLLVFGALGRWLNPVGPRTDAPRAARAGGLLPWQAPDDAMSASLAATPYRCYPYFHALEPRRPRVARAARQDELRREPRAPAHLLHLRRGEEHALPQPRTRDAARHGRVQAVGVPRAGHWCYKHEPELLPRVAQFVGARAWPSGPRALSLTRNAV